MRKCCQYQFSPTLFFQIFFCVYFSHIYYIFYIFFFLNTFRENKIKNKRVITQLYYMCKWLSSRLIHHLRSMAANNRYYLRRYLKTLLAACLTVEAGWERYSRNVEIYSGHPGSKQLRGITWKQVTLVIRFLPLFF